MSPEPPADPPPFVADPDTATAAVGVLQAELNLVAGNLDALDRKAALLLPFLGVIAGLTLPQTFTTTQALLVGAAVLAGIVAVYYVFRVILPTDNAIGPTAQEVAAAVHVAPTAFKVGVTIALARAIDHGAERSKTKGTNFRLATAFASIAILCLIGARLVGAIPVTDQEQSNPPPSSPAPIAPAPSQSQTVTPSQPAAPPTSNQTVPNFGLQTLEGSEPAIPVFGLQTLTRGAQPQITRDVKPDKTT
jgi:hypothetical protein